MSQRTVGGGLASQDDLRRDAAQPVHQLLLRVELHHLLALPAGDADVEPYQADQLAGAERSDVLQVETLGAGEAEQDGRVVGQPEPG